jgi:hypothetical protein
MAATPQVAGKCLIKISVASPWSVLLDLGYSRNGVDVDEEGFFGDVPGDENGGDSGPPIDIQYFGNTARVRLELTKFDRTVFDHLRKRVQGSTIGTPATSGTLMIAEGKYCRLCLVATNDNRNFPIAIPRNVISMNIGTRFQTAVCEFECHKDSNGVLWNTTVS